MSRVFIADWRYYILTTGILGCFLIVLGRLAYLHVWAADELALMAEQNRKGVQVQIARRGNILDARGNLLAATRPLIELGADPQVFRESDFEALPKLAGLLGKSAAELRSRIQDRIASPVSNPDGPRPVRWVKLADGIDDATYQHIQDLQIRGVYGNRYYERFYPAQSAAAHVLGFIGHIDEHVGAGDNARIETVRRPLLGIERYMDFYLRGQDGWREMELDGRRRELAQYRNEVRPTDGMDIELTLDMVVQSIVEEEIGRLVEMFEPAGVSIIVSDPKTGRIHAMANHPTFDPNEFWRYELDNLRNRAVSDIYEPGSTFKIVPAAGALNEGVANLDDAFDCSLGVAEYGGRSVRLPRDVSRNGILSFAQVVTKSSNRGAAHLGMRLGERRLFKYARAFGFGDRTGWGPGAEARGILHPVKEWDGLTISRLPMGHAISATPLQIHQAMSAIANDGVLMEPQIVRRVLGRDGAVVLEFSPRPIHRVVRKDVAETIAGLLNKATEPGGTGTRAAIPGYQVAGKSGTTQKIVDGRYSNTRHVATFSGFLPASNPVLAITVTVDEPNLKGTGYGGVVSAPAFKNIAERLIQYFSIEAPDQSKATSVALKGGNR